MPINLSGFGFDLCEQKQYCNTLWLIASNWGNHNLYVRFLLALWTLNFLHRPYFILFMRTPPPPSSSSLCVSGNQILKDFWECPVLWIAFLLHPQTIFYMMTKGKDDQRRLYKYQMWAHLSKLRSQLCSFW